MNPSAIVRQTLKNYVTIAWRNQSLGLDKDHIVTMNYTSEVREQYDAFRTALLQDRFFKHITRSSRIPSGKLLDDMGAYTLSGDSMQPINSDIQYVVSDYDFISTYGISIKVGRYFSRDYGPDSASFVINEAAGKAVGWKMRLMQRAKNLNMEIPGDVLLA